MSTETVRCDIDERGIAHLTIDRPKALNALNSDVLDGLDAGIRDLAAREEVRGVFVRGAGDKAFVAGADIGQMRELDPAGAEAFARRGLATLEQLERLPAPVVAVVDGYCLGGGCELALACDWIVATDQAVFGQPEVGLGIIPGFGGTQRLPRRIGPAAALDLITTGRQVDAHEAQRLGLAQHVVTADSLEQTLSGIAKAWLRNAPGAIRAAKEAIYTGADLPQDRALRLEASLFAGGFAGDEQAEGMAAFLEKRKPGYAG